MSAVEALPPTDASHVSRPERSVLLVLTTSRPAQGWQATVGHEWSIICAPQKQQVLELLVPLAAEALQLFEEHVATCQALVEEVQPRPGTDEQRATRPKYAAFKMAIMAVKAER